MTKQYYCSKFWVISIKVILPLADFSMLSVEHSPVLGGPARAVCGCLRLQGGGAGTHGAMRAGAGRARDMNFFVRVSEC